MKTTMLLVLVLGMTAAPPALGAGVGRHPADTITTTPKAETDGCRDAPNKILCAIDAQMARCKAHPDKCKANELTTGDICNVHPELPICKGGEVQS